jgi:hypothetical protein
LYAARFDQLDMPAYAMLSKSLPGLSMVPADMCHLSSCHDTLATNVMRIRNAVILGTDDSCDTKPE